MKGSAEASSNLHVQLHLQVQAASRGHWTVDTATDLQGLIRSRACWHSNEVNGSNARRAGTMLHKQALRRTTKATRCVSY